MSRYVFYESNGVRLLSFNVISLSILEFPIPIEKDGYWNDASNIGQGGIFIHYSRRLSYVP